MLSRLLRSLAPGLPVIIIPPSAEEILADAIRERGEALEAEIFGVSAAPTENLTLDTIREAMNRARAASPRLAMLDAASRLSRSCVERDAGRDEAVTRWIRHDALLQIVGAERLSL